VLIRFGFLLPREKMSFKMQAIKESNQDVFKVSCALYFLIIIIVFLPLLTTKTAWQVLDASMSWAQVRSECSLIHVKHPYSSLLPENLINHSAVTAQDFTAFENVTILFQGIGNNVVVDFKDGEYLRQLRIPNDSVIVEKKSSLLKKINNN